MAFGRSFMRTRTATVVALVGVLVTLGLQGGGNSLAATALLANEPSCNDG
jgi:hypothetical protein